MFTSPIQAVTFYTHPLNARVRGVLCKHPGDMYSLLIVLVVKLKYSVKEANFSGIFMTTMKRLSVQIICKST